jgi:two-component system, LuxR family, response regulator FixJ
MVAKARDDGQVERRRGQATISVHSTVATQRFDSDREVPHVAARLVDRSERMQPQTTHHQRLFVVDSDMATRDSICTLARSMGVEAESSGSVEEFRARCSGSPTGCLVVELRLPGISGLDLLESMGRDGIRIPTIALTAFADIPSVVRAMRAGAMTVLEKPLRDNEVSDEIGRALAIDRLWRRSEAKFREAQARLDSLTAEEAQVLDLLLAGSTNKGIAAHFHLGLRTVEYRRHTIMTKMGTPSLAQLARSVFEAKYRRLYLDLSHSVLPETTPDSGYSDHEEGWTERHSSRIRCESVHSW